MPWPEKAAGLLRKQLVCFEINVMISSPPDRGYGGSAPNALTS